MTVILTGEVIKIKKNVVTRVKRWHVVKYIPPNDSKQSVLLLIR